MHIDITPLIQALLLLLSVIITTFLVPYLKSKTSKETQDEINKWVAIAVTAAEQIYSGGGRGAEKKKYVKEWLEAHNITYDEQKIDAMIEAAVHDLKTKGIISTTD